MLKSTYTVTIEEIYPQYKVIENISIPKDFEGYEITEFRPPKNGEWFIGTGGLAMHAHSTEFFSGQPRAILKPNPNFVEATLESLPVTVNDIYKGGIKLPPGYKFLAFRMVNLGDMFVNCDTKMVTKVNYVGNIPTGPRIIVALEK